MSGEFRVLVVEGNDRVSTERMQQFGYSSYAETYAALLQKLDLRAACTIARPSEDGAGCINLKGFAGVAWTGSAMSAYEHRPEVKNQIEFALKVFDAGLPVFGSCWGLQIATQALGGKVRANPKGREIGIAKRIALKPGAAAHPMFAGKPGRFEALAVHQDEIEIPPANARVLASNAMSEVQAMTIESNGVDFWGVQYHPEFDFQTLAMTFRRIKKLLVKERVCANEDEAESLAQQFDAYEKDPAQLSSSIRDPHLRRAELSNWLESKVTRA